MRSSLKNTCIRSISILNISDYKDIKTSMNNTAPCSKCPLSVPGDRTCSRTSDHNVLSKETGSKYIPINQDSRRGLAF